MYLETFERFEIMPKRNGGSGDFINCFARITDAAEYWKNINLRLAVVLPPSIAYFPSNFISVILFRHVAVLLKYEQQIIRRTNFLFDIIVLFHYCDYSIANNK